jgi:CheY-like chemotaxis protein
VEIVCNDNGPGIPSDALRHVLERYYRVGQHIAGTGLGLAISREVVELHGGTIEVRSPVPGDEAGTSILITLPAASPPRILIVEDDEIVQELLSEQLMEEGYNVIGAGSAKSAIELVTEDASIGLVVLDVNLPDVNGTEVILQLRARRESARLPIVAVSGTEPAGGVADILHRFGIPLLRKPWRLDELLTRIGTAFFAGVGRV